MKFFYFTIDFLFGNFNLRINKRISVNTNIFKKTFQAFVLILKTSSGKNPKISLQKQKIS